jgi:hypothetical protein
MKRIKAVMGVAALAVAIAGEQWLRSKIRKAPGYAPRSLNYLR